MIVIIDYNMGNVQSVKNAFEAIGAEAIISGDIKDIETADKIVLPGVGAFGEGMKNLREKGILDVLNKQVIENKKPFLGICLGMQLIAKNSSEIGMNNGIGWINAIVRRLELDDLKLRVPHVGWNEVSILNKNPLFNEISSGACFYFVHSFHMICENKEDVAATCNYGKDFTAAVQKDNIFATQFHPEKSQKDGLQLLKNFVNYNPKN